MNHVFFKALVCVEAVAAQFKDDYVDCLVRVPKVSPLDGMIDRKESVNVEHLGRTVFFMVDLEA